MNKLNFKIKRFDGANEWFQDYSFDFEKGKTVLWALIKIREEQDPTLNFTSACRSAICGSCGIKVNGNAILACHTSLEKIIETYSTNDFVVEPLNNYKVLRDLVVDWEPKFERMEEVKPWLLPDESKECKKGFKQSEEEFEMISNPTDCILCGCCVSECTQHSTNAGGFYEPFIFSKSYRFTQDTRDNEAKEHLAPALETGGLWKCVRCMQCITKCPKGVRPADHISGLRKVSMEMGYKNNKGARHAYAFYKDVKETGRLNEVALPIRTEGLLHSIGRIPFALRLMSKGKVNPLHFQKPIKGIDGVRKIYKLVGKGEK